MTFDTGALIAFERGDRRVVAIVQRSLLHKREIGVPAGVVGQAWRSGRRQARLAAFLSLPIVAIEPLDDTAARAAGQLCGARRTHDVIDASVAICARRRGGTVLTSDPDDLRWLDPSLDVIVV